MGFIARIYSDLVRIEFGARKRTRTSTPLREPGPEPGASANSAIRAQLRRVKHVEITRSEAFSFCPATPPLSTKARWLELR
jgi:hypothetical protein